MRDPDVPSSNYDNRPLNDLSPQQFAWTFQGGQLVLTDHSGGITYRWEGTG